MHKEEHHLGLSQAAADALAGAEAKGQGLEAGVVIAKPTGGVVALGVREDVRAAPHGVEGHLAQRLLGRGARGHAGKPRHHQAKRSLGEAKRLLGQTKVMGQAKASLGQAKMSLGHSKTLLGQEAESSQEVGWGAATIGSPPPWPRPLTPAGTW